MTRLTGTLIKNFYHCKRQAYLYYYGLNFRNEIIRIGEIMHEEQKSKELVFEKVKVDDIKGDLLIEYKKTSSNLNGTRMQVLYYLKTLAEKGVFLKGVVRDLTYQKDYAVEFNEETENELQQMEQAITKMISNSIPARKEKRKECRGCSFFDYCWSE